MSRPPSQCGHPTDRYFDPARSRAYQPYHYEPRHRPPNVYDRPLAAPGPRLPPLAQLTDQSADPRYLPASDNVYMGHPIMPMALPMRMQYGSAIELRGHPGPDEERPMSMLSHGREYASYSMRTYDEESQRSSSSAVMPSPAHSEKSPLAIKSDPAAGPPPERKEAPRTPTSMIPHGFDKILHHEPESSPSPSPSPSPPPDRASIRPRCHLHIRQQPVAARACGADRDRRIIDPPPIVQMLLTDFDPESQDDRDILQDPRFSVGSLLFPVSESTGLPVPPEEKPNLPDWPEGPDNDGVARNDDTNAPLLSGKCFTSPFYADADPDPNSAPTHPSSSDVKAPPSPPGHLCNAGKLHQPATFFIFTDLSIRTAGLYRLKFTLLNWGDCEDTFQQIPTIAEAWSDPFRVYPAKDFPGMQDSSILVDGLKELGVIELNSRGKGKGRGKKKD